MTSEQQRLSDDVPFELEELDSDRVVARFAEYVDGRRTSALEDSLSTAIRRHQKTACDVRDSKEIVSEWLVLLADLSVEARKSGHRVSVVGLNENLRKSADVLGLEGQLTLVSSIEEAWT